MGNLNIADGKAVKNKRDDRDVNKKMTDNNDDNEFATGFKNYSAESKDSASINPAQSITESATEWKEQKISEVEGRILSRLPQIGDAIERAGEMIQDFGKLVYHFGNRIEHYKLDEKAKTNEASSSHATH